MIKKTRMTARLEQWFNGEISDDDLTEPEVRELARRVFDIVTEKTLARVDVQTFSDHETIQ